MKKNNILTFLLVVIIALLSIGITVVIIIITRGGLITTDGIVKTGIVRIKVIPSNIKPKIYVDDELVTLQEKKINNLPEGEYTIRIENENYRTWERTVKVKNEIVLDVSAKLYPEEFSLEQISDVNIDKAFYSNNGEYVYYSVMNDENEENNGIWRMKLSRNIFIFGGLENNPEKITSLSDSLIEIMNDGQYSIIPSDENSKILISDTDFKASFVYNASSFNTDPEINVQEILGIEPENLYWYSDADSLLVEETNLLYIHNLETGTDTLIKYFKDDQPIYSIGESAVFVYNSGTNEVQIFRNGALESIEMGPKILNSVIALHTPYNNEQFLLVQYPQYNEYIDLENGYSDTTIDSTYQFLSMSNDGTSALYTKEGKLYSFIAKEIVATETLETNIFDTGFLLSNEDKVGFIQQSTHILHYSPATNNLFIAEVDGENKTILLNQDDMQKDDYKINSDGKYAVFLISTVVENTEISVVDNTKYLFRASLEYDE